MSINRWYVRCTVISALLCAPVSTGQAQDDLFGARNATSVEDVDVDQAAPEGGSPAGEESIVTAELPNDATDDEVDFCRCVGESDSRAVERIQQALRGSLKSNGLDFTQTPLEEIVNLLQDDYGIPIQLDIPAIEAAGLDSSEQVTMSVHKVSLQSALRLMLKRLQLTYIIQDEVLLFTTPEEADSELRICVYNVRGFVEHTSDKSVDALIDTIVSCVSTDTWAENGGGEAEIRPLKPGLIVISQTQAVHEEITSLLNAVHDMRDSQAAAGDAAGAAPPEANADQVVTQSYILQINQAGDPEKFRNQVRELIVQSMPDEQWEGRLGDGQPVLLTVLPDRVVVRHKPSVQEAVQSIVVDSGVAAPAGSATFRRGGSGQGGGIDGDGKKAGGLSGGGGGTFSLQSPARE